MHTQDRAALDAAEWPTEHPRTLRLSDIPPGRRRFYVEDEDGAAHHISDAQCPSTSRRLRDTEARTLKALEQFEPGVPIWECRLDLLPHLDIHEPADRAQIVQRLKVLVGPWRAVFYLHDVRTLSLEPDRPHVHVAQQAWERPATGPGGWDWVCPLPLDRDRMEMRHEGEAEGTLYGMLWYSTRPALPGAARPDRGEVARYSTEQLNAHRTAAVKRRNVATAKARARAQVQGKQRGHVARAFGWINETRPPRKPRTLPSPSSGIPNPSPHLHLPQFDLEEAA